MMKLFSKNPVEKLQKRYETLMLEAMTAQRGGNIVKSSELHAQAEEVLKQIDELNAG
ncbi:MAG: DUF6435 family protein [Kiritimatiellia bacterium]